MIKINSHSVVEVEGMTNDEAWEILWAYLCVKNDATYAVYFKDGIVIGDRDYFEEEKMKQYKVYDNLVAKVSSWWDMVYPAGIFTGVSGDEGAVKVAEIRELLDKIKALSERNKG